MSEEKTKDIILELKKSFLADKKDIQDQIVEAETQIRQDKEYIESLSKKDDNDYNVFSPRNASRVYKDQVDEKKLEIEQLEELVRNLYRKLSSITKKMDSLSELAPDEVKTYGNAIKNAGSKAELLKLQEDDRQRIAADLHDTVLQNLTLVMHNLELSGKFIDYDPIRAKLEIEANRKLVKQTIDDIRSTIFDLRPMQFDDFGFKKTMENQILNYMTRTSMQVTYKIDELADIDHIFLLTVFRVTQELMINAIKHSNGSSLDILVERVSYGIFVKVKDDGKGTENYNAQKDDHFGLKILQERVNVLGGTVKINSTKEGTAVTVEIPVINE